IRGSSTAPQRLLRPAYLAILPLPGADVCSNLRGRTLGWQRYMIDGEGECFPEASREGRWLSYAELSRVRRIGRESAVKLVQREGWRRIRGNDGTARVLVPPDWLKPARQDTPEPSLGSSPERVV